MSVTLQLRGDTAAAWAAANPVLAQREPALELDTGLMKIGDGLSAWADLGYWHGGDVDPASFVDLQDEVVEARGGRSSLDKRIEAVSRYSSPCVGTLVSGEVLDNALTSVGPTTLAGAVNAIRLVPFTNSRPLSIQAMGIRITTAAVGSTCRFLIYESGLDGWPGDKVFESDPVSTAVVGVVQTPVSLTFDADRVYWLGYWTSSSPTCHAVQAYGAPNLGLIGGIAGTTYAGLIQRTMLVYAGNTAPSPFGLVMSERVAGNPPAIRLVVA